MIKITSKIRNNKSLCNVIREMNKKDKGISRESDVFSFNRPNCSKGYLNLLYTMNKLKTFTWEQLMMSSSARENIIKRYDINIKCFVHFTKRFGFSDDSLNSLHTFHKYVTNYFNCYKTFFRNYGIIETIGNRKLGKMKFTKLGEKLLKALMHFE